MTEPFSPNSFSRRRLLAVAAVISATAIALPSAASEDDAVRGAFPWQDGRGAMPEVASRTGKQFLTASERPFATAVADRIIPPDETGPSASEAGVPDFIESQLAGAYGAGSHLYLGGPWPTGTPSQGVQSRPAPAAFDRTAIAEIEAWIGDRHAGASFAALAADLQDEDLLHPEAGRATLRSIGGSAFFALLLENVREGYFSDPAYGGNRDMAA